MFINGSIVWLTNVAPGSPCSMPAPCAFAELTDAFPDAVWRRAQLGLGSGVPAVTSIADNVPIADGGSETALVTDFGPPPAPSTTEPVAARDGSSGEVPIIVAVAVLLGAAGLGLVILAGRRRPRSPTG